jgi:hypothetical protein
MRTEAARNGEMEEILDEIEEFLEGQMDVVDGSYGEPHPNRAMQLLAALQAARNFTRKTAGTCNCYVSPHEPGCSIFVGLTESGERIIASQGGDVHEV